MNPDPDKTARDRPRAHALDALRGGALAAMILFHFTWDLDYFGLIAPGLTGSTTVHWIGDALATVFLIVVGVSLALASREGFRPRAFALRLMKIGAAAGLVTLATWFVFPDEFIFFGILHCIALSSLVAAPFLRAPLLLVVLVAAGALLAPVFLTSPVFNASYWLWLGLGTRIPLSNDWRPFLPWFGVVLLGLALARAGAGRYLPKALTAYRPTGPVGRALDIGGRRSLFIYLVHQPLLFGALYLAVLAAGRGPPSETMTFTRNCAAQCIAQGARQAYCSRVCGCVAGLAAPSPIWRPILEGKLSKPQQDKLNDMASECIAKAHRDPP